MAKKHVNLTRRKMSHILDELYTGLLHAGAKDVNIHISREEAGLRVSIGSDYAAEHRHHMENVARLLQPTVRDPGLVEAYWELAGGDQYSSDSELALVGQMLDSARVTVEDDRVEMELYIAF